MTTAGQTLLKECWHISSCVAVEDEICTCESMLVMALRDVEYEVKMDAASRVTTLCLNHGIRPTEFIAAVKGD